ncbi:hypothetical protein [Faecalicatena contorta]|uniref:hypothetical protein n=1 Tax=Faecalicatena contorta TaxID=39482 RepID=UPI00129D618E|nr:hypothetical protein [Faecalicatena contorta]MEE0199613.1 hypothetical protein [Muricomes sp.]
MSALSYDGWERLVEEGGRCFPASWGMRRWIGLAGDVIELDMRTAVFWLEVL